MSPIVSSSVLSRSSEGVFETIPIFRCPSANDSVSGEYERCLGVVDELRRLLRETINLSIQARLALLVY